MLTHLMQSPYQMLRKVGAEYDYVTMDTLRRKINDSVHGKLEVKKKEHTYLEPVPCMRACVMLVCRLMITLVCLVVAQSAQQGKLSTPPAMPAPPPRKLSSDVQADRPPSSSPLAKQPGAVTTTATQNKSMGEYDNPRRLVEQSIAPLDRRPTLDCM